MITKGMPTKSKGRYSIVPIVEVFDCVQFSLAPNYDGGLEVALAIAIQTNHGPSQNGLKLDYTIL